MRVRSTAAGVAAVLLMAAVTAYGQQVLTLEALLERVAASNPAVKAAAGRWSSAQERARAAEGFEPPRVSVEYRGIPEGDISLGQAPEKMFAVRQAFPFVGKRGFAAQAAQAAAEGERWNMMDTQSRVLAEARSAYAAYWAANRLYTVAGETQKIFADAVRSLEARYSSAGVSDADVAMARIEAERLAVMRDALSADMAGRAAELNALMGADPGADAGIPQESLPVEASVEWERVRAAVLGTSPQLGRERQSREQMKWAARGAARDLWPDLEVTYRRGIMNDAWNGSELMLEVSLPLWSLRQRGALRAAARDSESAALQLDDAERSALAAARRLSEQLNAAASSLERYRRVIIPAAEQSLSTGRAAFAAGRVSIDDIRARAQLYLETQKEYAGLVTDYGRMRAELDRLCGASAEGK